MKQCVCVRVHVRTDTDSVRLVDREKQHGDNKLLNEVGFNVVVSQG